MQNTMTLVTLVLRPERRRPPSASPPMPRRSRPSRPRWISHHDQHRDDDERQHDVVVALVAAARRRGAACARPSANVGEHEAAASRTAARPGSRSRASPAPGTARTAGSPGIATSAPTGTATSPASRSATIHGMPCVDVELREGDRADGGERRRAQRHLPAVRTSRPSDSRISSDRVSAVIQNDELRRPTTCGTTPASANTTTPATEPQRPGGRATGGSAAPRRDDGGASLRRGVTSSTTNRTMNGRLGGKPASQATSSTYFVEHVGGDADDAGRRGT